MADHTHGIDHRGTPIQISSLTEDIAHHSITGIRTVWHTSIATTLTPENLANILLAVDDNGDIYEYLTLAEEMEERDLHYHSVISTRRLAVSSLDLVVESVADDAENIKIADFVREVMTDEDTVRELLADQLDALGKGFSVSEIMWNRDESKWVPDKYVWRDPRFFQFDRVTGDILSLRDEANVVDGIPLAAYKFIVHTPKIKSGLKVRGGLARLAAVAFMCKGYSLKDWMAFAEVYGMPLRVGKYGSGASPAQKTELLRAVANIGTDAAAIIPESMQIEFINAMKSGGTASEIIFESLSNWLDRQVSKGVLGQTMTTDDGSSLAQAKVHDNVRGDIVISDAVQLSATLRRDLVKPLVDLNFGPRKRNEYPVVRLVIEEPEDLESLSKSLPPFIDRGLPVEVSVILDKFGLTEPADDAVLLGGIKSVDEQETKDDEKEKDDKDDDKGSKHDDDDEKDNASKHDDDEFLKKTRSLISAQLLSVHRDDVHEIWMSKITFASRDDAERWLTAHDFKSSLTRETDELWVYMQHPKSAFTDMPFWQMAYTRGVRAVVGRLKTKVLQQSQRESHIELMQRVIKGETLTEDQRTLLSMFQMAPDRIDQLVETEMGGWRQVMNPMLSPILELAQRSGDYDEFIEGLDALANDMDVEPLVRSLATATLKSRGLGDRLDRV